MEYPINQSASSRARQDTERFRQSAKYFWAFEVVGAAIFAVVGAVLGLVLTPKNATQNAQFVFPAVGGAVGVILGFLITFGIIFLRFLVSAPYKQRNEVRALLKAKPKSVFLPIRDSLLRTIIEAKLATIDVAENIENIRHKEMGNTVFIDPNMWDKLDGIQRRFGYARGALERDIFAAGSTFEPILKPLFEYIQSATKLDSSTINDYKTKLEQMTKITRDKIDELSLSVPDKEDSQTERV